MAFRKGLRDSRPIGWIPYEIRQELVQLRSEFVRRYDHDSLLILEDIVWRETNDRLIWRHGPLLLAFASGRFSYRDSQIAHAKAEIRALRNRLYPVVDECPWSTDVKLDDLIIRFGPFHPAVYARSV